LINMVGIKNRIIEMIDVFLEKEYN
jgi:hypothetical protein